MIEEERNNKWKFLLSMNNEAYVILKKENCAPDDLISLRRMSRDYYVRYCEDIGLVGIKITCACLAPVACFTEWNDTKTYIVILNRGRRVSMLKL